MARPINHIRKLTQTGRGKSYSVIIPAEFVREIGWRDKQRLLIQKINGAIVIRDAKTKKRK